MIFHSCAQKDFLDTRMVEVEEKVRRRQRTVEWRLDKQWGLLAFPRFIIPPNEYPVTWSERKKILLSPTLPENSAVYVLATGCREGGIRARGETFDWHQVGTNLTLTVTSFDVKR